ncbi:uncharacterized protein LOC110830339 [Zootermopsis nevadensis]|uniref:uncharacterized protein LOC110830339 n=1 Tax=Zootermopsis nevadensis TaxID=136037 RepID=UPI000B8E5DFC|nr:uncharacterized protein LOC110830339 [Zootermopsis nevadensis]
MPRTPSTNKMKYFMLMVLICKCRTSPTGLQRNFSQECSRSGCENFAGCGLGGMYLNLQDSRYNLGTWPGQLICGLRLNTGPPKYESGVLITWMLCSINICTYFYTLPTKLNLKTR